jgi:diguanylate cyclase (GGDEF)-like protein
MTIATSDTVSSTATPASRSRLPRLTSLPPELLLAAQQSVLDMVARGAPLQRTLSAIARFSEEAIPTMMASVLVFEPESGELRRGGYGRLPDSFQAAIDGMKPGPVSGSCGTAAYRSNRVISRDVQNDPLWEPFKAFAAQYGIASAWSTPLKDSQGNLLGVFGMYYGDCREPSADDLELVDHFTHLAAIAVERDRHDAERERQAMLDGLTGLGNRQKLQTFAANLAIDNGRNALPHVLALLDVDHFKLHNDTLGQRSSDRLLAATAQRLQLMLGDAELLARFGGDQFVAIFAGDPETARGRVEQALESFTEPVDLGDARVTLSLSAGIVAWEPRTTSLDDALFQTIEAVEVAKRLGRDRCVVFGESERAKLVGRRQVARLLKEALEDDRVEPWLQPIVSLPAGGAVSLEVLARLKGTGVAGISPAVFIPIAEESSLIDTLGLSVLRFAFRTLAERATLLAGCTLHVNVSTRQLLRGTLCDRAVELSREFGVTTDRITLEVTESQWLESESPAREQLLQLREAGFRLALDDFGSGYASLNQLLTIPFDMVKMDRSFTAQLVQGPRGRALCDVALSMATACGMPAVAEGVETPQQAQALTQMGFQLGQGYLWAKPMPLNDALAWLKR